MVYSTEQRVFIVKTWYQTNQSPSETLRKWSTAYKNLRKPSKSTVLDLVRKFETTGSVHDARKGHVGAPRSARTPENVEQARRTLTEEPATSTRKLASQLEVSVGSAHSILTHDLQLFPYKIQTLQHLNAASIEKREVFANQIVQLIDTKQLNVDCVWFSDEAHFWLSGYVNKQNYRIWGSEKPVFTETRPLHPAKVTVWAALSRNKLVGPVFFESTVKSESYKAMLENVFLPEIRRLGMDTGFWFMQDGAPPHRTLGVFRTINSQFGDHVLALNYPNHYPGAIDWPPYSPDANPCDFFLWGCIKDLVYKSRPQTVNELKDAITQAFSTVTHDTLDKVIANFEARMRHLVVTEGQHFENLIT